MNKNYYLICFFLMVSNSVCAQSFGLFNTRTLFDAFENPAVKAFTLDSSSKYASNFFLPNFSFHASNKGSSETVIRQLTSEGSYDTKNLPIGSGLINKAFQSTNIYLLTFRIFTTHQYNQEVGFAWQIKSDAMAKYTNETLAIFDNYKRFDEDRPNIGLFNTNGFQQSYHQFSVSIRENWNKQLALGVKLSLLSGIAYNSLSINNSSLYIDSRNDNLNIGLSGTYKGSFLMSDELGKSTLFPTFKNPGLSLTVGSSYNSKSGYFLMGNIKDLGLIRWSKNSHIAELNGITSISDVSQKDNERINNEITDIVYAVDKRKAFTTPTDAKADFLISKPFGFYKPSLILSKSLFNSAGHLAIVNSFNYNNLTASLIPNYNFNNFLMIGLQGMYKTPNFEFYLGSDNIGKSISMARGIATSDATVGKGYNSGSFYMGLGIKFGRTVNHPMNLSTMPGVNGERIYKGFFRSLFDFFKK